MMADTSWSKSHFWELFCKQHKIILFLLRNNANLHNANLEFCSIPMNSLEEKVKRLSAQQF